MNRHEYIEKLKAELYSLSEAEKENAVTFYEEYISDSNNEDETMRILGSPRRLARQILKEMKKNGEVAEPDNITTQEPPPFFDNNAPAYSSEFQDDNGEPPPAPDNGSEPYDEPSEKQRPPMPVKPKVLILVAIILLSPVILGAAGTVLGITLGFLGGVFALLIATVAVMFAFVMIGFALLVAGAVILAFAVMSIISGGAPLVLLPLGIALILLSLGIAVTHLSVILFAKSCKMLPAIISAIAKGLGKLFGKIKGGIQ